MIAHSQILLRFLLVVSTLCSIHSYRPITSRVNKAASNFAIQCKSGGLSVGSTFNSPDSVSAMMKDVAKAIIAARDQQVSVALVDVPVPVTGKLRNKNLQEPVKQISSLL